MRWRRTCMLIASVGIAFLVLKFVVFSPKTPGRGSKIPHLPPNPWTRQAPIGPSRKAPSFNPTSSHPIDQLIKDGQQRFESLKRRQSKTLKEAVAEYKRRYRIPPPPHFDKWYNYAKKRGMQLIDEFDIVHENLTPFWALDPASLRLRVREALGYSTNGLITLKVRDGKATWISGGPEWQQNETLQMVEDFVHDLPDMDLAFNVHDEPRIAVPHDELSRIVNMAQHTTMRRAFANEKPRNSFSKRPSDVDDGRRRIKETKTSRFNEYPRQATWVPSTLSCHPDSPARDFRDNIADDTNEWAFSDLGFIYNHTAFADVCKSPSLRENFGFFQGPNAYKVAHELVPVFTQSKVSSHQDILYPSPWYHYGKTVTDQPADTHQIQYNETLDVDWHSKNTTFWWRGSTTGGYSRESGWRRQHRQLFVRRINAEDEARILENKGTSDTPNWQVKEVPRDQYRNLIDVHFSGVGQCDKGDCEAQWEYWDMAKPVDPQLAWKYKYLVDMDGNAFSGRFYSFLHSKSLPFKISIFNEWHERWLQPWVHYVPLSLKGTEHLEAVRYFTYEREGKVHAERIAMQGREWADKALRNDDLDAYFFRLLLEYARLVDDDRESIGFSL